MVDSDPTKVYAAVPQDWASLSDDEKTAWSLAFYDAIMARRPKVSEQDTAEDEL